MNQNLKDELRNIISGKSPVRHGSPIQAIANYLAESAGSSQKTQDTKQIRKQEEQYLIRYADAHGLWTKVDTSNYVSEGAEQRVYLKDATSVVFYLTDDFWK